MGTIHLSMALGAFLIAATCYAKEPARSDTNTYCVGRFLVDAPKDAQINEQAYEYLLGQVASDTPAADEQHFAQLMEKREADLKAGKQKDGYTLKAIRTPSPSIRVFELSQNLLMGPSLALEAYRWDRGHVFSVSQKGFDAKKYPNILSRLQADFLPNLHARNAEDIPSQPGFCLNDGFIASDGRAHQNEDAGISFKFARWPGVLISVRTMTIAKVGEPTLLQRVDSGSVPEAFANFVNRIRVLRRGHRLINGRDGEELLETVPAEGGYHLHQFRWEAQGTTVGDALKPTLVVEFESGMTSVNGYPVHPKLTDDQAIAVFDAVANSVRIRPVVDIKTSAADPLPTLPLSVLVQTGSICPQTGWWTCLGASSHVLEGGGPQHFTAGTVLTTATVLSTPTIPDRIRGRQSRHALNTTWRLVDYDADQIDSKGTTDSRLSPSYMGKELSMRAASRES
jgi:hypothetical protein